MKNIFAFVLCFVLVFGCVSFAFAEASITTVSPYYAGTSTTITNSINPECFDGSNCLSGYIVYDLAGLDNSEDITVSGPVVLNIETAGYNRYLSVYLSAKSSNNAGATKNLTRLSASSSDVGAVEMTLNYTIPAGYVDDYYLVFMPYIATANISGVTVSALSSPVPAPTGSYNLPCGNTIYIDLGTGTSFDLSFDCTFRDTAGGLNSTFSNTFYYTFANSIPQTTSSFTPSVGTYITMYKDMDSANIFGFTKVGYGSISGTTTGQYLVIVNPLMFAQTTNVYNTTLKISGIPSGTTIFTYPVTSSISGNEVMSTINNSVGGTGTVSASGGAITTVSTEDSSITYIPNAGGNTVLNSDENIVEGYLSGLNDTLNEFFNNFISLFSKPISYIQSLIASGSNFISHLAFLWSWLPAEISSVIQSAMIVTISVAVFKVFL